MNKMLTVVKFTFLNRFRSKAFLISSIIFALLLTVGINLPGIISSFNTGKVTSVGMLETGSDIPAKLDAYFKSQEEPGIRIVMFKGQGSREANDRMVREKIAAKDIKGFLELSDAPAAGFPKFTYKSEGIMETGTTGKLETALQAIKQETLAKNAGMSQEQLVQLLQPIPVDTLQIKTNADGAGKTPSQIIVSYILVYALLILFFMVINMYGNLIATEITAEKSSRVMELLISSISPLKQMFGKVIGMLLLGIIQIAVFVVVAVINLNLPNNSGFLKKMNLNFSDTPISLYVYFVVFFLLGFFLFAMLYAAVGSLISRTEDLGQAIMPVMFLALASFYIGIFGINNPTSTFVTVASFIPFFTPLIMFLRIGMANPTTWEILLSIAILLAAILVVGWLSAKIYRTGVLMYGKRPSFKELRKAMKAFKV